MARETTGQKASPHRSRGQGRSPGAGKRPWRPHGDRPRGSAPAGGKDKPGAATARPAPRAELAGLGARRVAVQLIEGVIGGKRPLDNVLEGLDRDAALASLEARDRGFGRLIGATVLRHAGSLDAVLARFLERPLPDDEHRARAILLAGAAQILLLGTPAHAAINLAVEQCRHDRKAHRFAKLTNAVLRKVAREGPAILAALDTLALDVPGWLLERWSVAYGETQAREIARASLREAPLDVSLKEPDEAAAWAESLGGLALPTGSVRLVEHGRVEELAGYGDGAWWVQDAAAALPAMLMRHIAGLEVADLCAAPGGKTASLAARGARVTAVDSSPGRLERLEANMARLGLEDRVSVVADDIATWEPGRRFDGVLLDAPCTATGTIRRHPDILHLKREDDVARLAQYQARLLARASRHVKPGGLLVYCVCSLEPEEGPAVVEAFLAGHPEFVREPISSVELGGAVAAPWITPAGDMRTLPCYRVLPQPTGSSEANGAAGDAGAGLDGFYAARVRRGTL